MKGLPIIIAALSSLVGTCQKFKSNSREEIFEKCNLQRYQDTPNDDRDSNGNDTKIGLAIHVYRFLGIEDTEESMDIIGNAIVTVNVPCLKNIYQNVSWPKHKKKLSHENAENYWRPNLIHANSLGSNSLESDSFEKHFVMDMENGFLHYSFWGRFRSFCNLDLKLFPFDKQTCPLVFVFYDAFILQLGEIRVYRSHEAMRQNANWMQLDQVDSLQQLTNLNIDTSDFNKTGRVIIWMSYKRLSNYYIVNLILPSIVLCILELASFLIPADSSDRCTFAATIMLSLFLLHSQTLSYLPQTPKPLLAAYYIILEIAFATTCTIYSAAMLYLITNVPKMKQNLRKTEPLWKIVDKISASFALFSLFLINITTAALFDLVF